MAHELDPMRAHAGTVYRKLQTSFSTRSTCLDHSIGKLNQDSHTTGRDWIGTWIQGSDSLILPSCTTVLYADRYFNPLSIKKPVSCFPDLVIHLWLWFVHLKPSLMPRSRALRGLLPQHLLYYTPHTDVPLLNWLDIPISVAHRRYADLIIS